MLVVTAIVAGLIIVALTAASAGVYDAVAENDGISGLERPALDQVTAWRTPLANHLFTWFTDLGGPLRMTLIARVVTLLLVWWWRTLTPLLLMIIAVAGSLTFTHVSPCVSSGQRRWGSAGSSSGNGAVSRSQWSWHEIVSCPRWPVAAPWPPD